MIRPAVLDLVGDEVAAAHGCAHLDRRNADESLDQVFHDGGLAIDLADAMDQPVLLGIQGRQTWSIFSRFGFSDRPRISKRPPEKGGGIRLWSVPEAG